MAVATSSILTGAPAAPADVGPPVPGPTRAGGGADPVGGPAPGRGRLLGLPAPPRQVAGGLLRHRLARRLRQRLLAGQHAPARRAPAAHGPMRGAPRAAGPRRDRRRGCGGPGRACRGSDRPAHRRPAGPAGPRQHGPGRHGRRGCVDRARRLAQGKAGGERDHRQPADGLHRHGALQPPGRRPVARPLEPQQAIHLRHRRRQHAGARPRHRAPPRPARRHHCLPRLLDPDLPHQLRLRLPGSPAATCAPPSSRACPWPA